MNRRDFLALAATAAAVAPLPGRAQPRVARIGLLGVPSPGDPQTAPIWQAFLAALREKGWSLGANVVFDRRWSEGRAEGFAAGAAELVATQPDLIIALTAQAIEAAHSQTGGIPIVAIGGTDLVALGLVKGLAHPGGNITGFATELGSISGQWLQMLQQTRPGLSRVAALYTATNPASKAETEASVSLAPRLGLAMEIIAVEAPEDIPAAFSKILQYRADGLIVHPTPLLWSHAAEIAAFAIAHRLPSATGFAPLARDGLLLSYSADFVDMWQRAAGVVDKLLRGAKPADIPVELPTKFTFLVNLKTARALELAIPPILLARADEVIE